VTTPTVLPARNQVLALAAANRPDLDPAHLAGILDDAKYHGLGPVRVQQEATRMLWCGGDLRDLRKALDGAVLIRGGSR